MILAINRLAFFSLGEQYDMLDCHRFQVLKLLGMKLMIFNLLVDDFFIMLV